MTPPAMLVGPNPLQALAPVPTLGRMMVFVDGENLVHRFQGMCESGRKRREEVVHEKDVLAWTHLAIKPRLNQVIRATYYTYVKGNEERQREINEKIKELRIQQYNVPGATYASHGLIKHLHPRTFRKIKDRKSKGVDIQMTVDILTNVHMNNLDAVYLVSGDGDYKPVVEEAMRNGKHVFIAALSSGLNKDLRFLGDDFIDLDQYFFKS